MRGAVVKVACSVGRPTTLRHPVQLLYPLEVSQCDREVMPCADTTSNVTETELRRSTRDASKIAQQFIGLQAEDDF